MPLTKYKVDKIIDGHMHPRDPEAVANRKKAMVGTERVTKWTSEHHRFHSPTYQVTLGKPEPGRDYFQNPYEVSELIDRMDEAGVAKGCMISLPPFTPDEHVKRLYLDPHPDRFVGVSWVNPDNIHRAIKEMERSITEWGFKGFKVHPAHAGRTADHRDFFPFYEKCIELNVPCWIHSGYIPYSTFRLRDDDPLAIDEVACRFPELTIVMCHLGWPHVDQALAVCLKHPNVFMETSAIHPFFWPESFIKFMNSILQDKVVFATDWNLLQIDDTIVETEKLIASQQIAEKVFRDNWKKILGPDIV